MFVGSFAHCRSNPWPSQTARKRLMVFRTLKPRSTGIPIGNPGLAGQVSASVPRSSCLSFGLALWLCCFLLFLATSAHAAQAPPSGKIIDTRGRVEVSLHVGPEWKKAAPGTELKAGEAVRTGADGWAAVLLADETLVQLNRNTLFILKKITPTAGWLGRQAVRPAAESASDSLYRLESGEAWFRNKNRDTRIDIETPTITGGLRGTELNLRVEPDRTVVLTVLEGSVAAWNDTGNTDVRAGERIIARPGKPISKELLLSPQDAVQWTITLPDLVEPRDLPLVTVDRASAEQQLRSLRTRLEEDPQDPESKEALAWLLRDLGDAEAAASLFREVLSEHPRRSDALTGLAWTRLDQDDPQGALSLLASVSQPNARTFLGFSAAYGRSNRTEEALEMIRRGIALYPDFPRFRIQEALILMRDRRIRDAGEILRVVIGKFPDMGPAWSLTALISLLEGDKETALGQARRGTENASTSPSSWIVLGYVQQSVFDLDGAGKSLEHAIDLDPNNVTALVHLARLKFGSDDMDQARSLVETALDQSPLSADAWNLHGFIRLALRKTGSALSSFEKALDIDPGMAEPHLGLALAFMRLGETNRAQEEITTAVLLEPGRSLFLSYWGKMLAQTGRFEKALELFEEAAILDPEDPTPHLYRSILLRDLNRSSEAVKALNRSMELNDRRAVYRSRFLLDRDLAVKNVNLSVIYDQLGLSAWAAGKASASVKQDYTNFAGHLFLSGAYFAQEGLGRVGASEALVARILQPANLNSFNRFNDYTSFFERPAINGTLTGYMGTQESFGGSALFYGALPGLDTAFSFGANHAETQGWRETDYERSSGASTTLKWDPTPRDGVMLAASHFDGKQGDAIYPRFEVSSPADPEEYSKTRLSRLELGYHHHFSPHTDFMFFSTLLNTHGTLVNHEVYGPFEFPPDPSFSIETLEQDDFARPYIQIQAQQWFRFGDHQLMAGTVHFWGDNDLDARIDYFYNENGDRIPLEPETFSNRLCNEFHSYYVQDVWTLTPQLVLEASAYLDSIRKSNSYNGTHWTRDEFNPRLGLIAGPFRGHTFRLAAFRYLLPFDANRIDPLEIAGIPIFRNALEGAVAEEADLAWEYEWSSGFVAANLFYLERRFTSSYREDDAVVESTERGRSRGFRTSWNQLVGEGLGFAAEYRFMDVDDENLPETDRRDHLASARLVFVHSTGISAQLSETFRLQDMKSADRSNESLWITDLGIAYEFPGKTGAIRLDIRNLFDRQFDWVTDLFVFNGRIPEREIFLTLSVNF